MFRKNPAAHPVQAVALVHALHPRGHAVQTYKQHTFNNFIN